MIIAASLLDAWHKMVSEGNNRHIFRKRPWGKPLTELLPIVMAQTDGGTKQSTLYCGLVKIKTSKRSMRSCA